MTSDILEAMQFIPDTTEINNGTFDNQHEMHEPQPTHTYAKSASSYPNDLATMDISEADDTLLSCSSTQSKQVPKRNEIKVSERGQVSPMQDKLITDSVEFFGS